MNRNHPSRPATAPHGTSSPWRRALMLGIAVGSLAACAQPVKLPPPLRDPKPEVAGDDGLIGGGNARSRPRIEASAPPAPPPTQDVAAEPPVPPIAVKEPIKLALDGVPLASFINIVYGTELGFALEIDQAVRSRSDLMSLRLTESHKPEDVYRIATEVLRNYGVRVVPSGGVLRFVPVASAAAANSVVVTRSSPDVPAGQRTTFVAVPLDASEPGRVAAQLRTMLNGQPVTIVEMLEANAVLLSGPGDAVQAGVSAAVALDRASLRDKQSIRINPMYLPADLLARELKEVLNAQGYTVRTGPGTTGALTFVPVASANALIIFGESEAAMKAAAEWAEKLDQPADQAGGGVYMYAAKHTTVETMLPVLEAMVGGAASASGAPSSASGAAARNGADNGNSSSRATPRSATISGAGGQLALDPVRNVIVFQGDAQRWRAIQGVLARLDTPARQVVIEVTVAEVTLTDEFSHGVEWALRNIGIDGMNGPVGALAGGSTPAGALVWRALSGSGQTRALVNLFAKDGRVSILSTPRLMVKSGESASIDVGTEVPIITQQATAPDIDLGNRPSILQSVQYRKTGVLLDLTAVVHSGQRVDLKLTQEVSEAQQTDTSQISSPSIFSRKLTTSLSLADGQSMLLGGLISSSKSDSKTKVPLLGDIPLIGAAFQNRRKQGTRTELLMLITPYVVEDAQQAREITDAVQARFGNSKP